MVNYHIIRFIKEYIGSIQTNLGLMIKILTTYHWKKSIVVIVQMLIAIKNYVSVLIKIWIRLMSMIIKAKTQLKLE